eukprot:g6598.t1
MGPRESPTPERRAGEGGNGAAADISRVDVHHTTAVRSLNALNENIRSLLEVDFPAYGVARPSTLVSLSLHSNRISSFEGFSAMTALVALNLSSNELDGAAIRSSAPHLGALSSLESLDLSCNRIDELLGLPFLPRLSRLLVPYNRLGSLDGVQALASSLTYLDARDNRIAGPPGAHAPHLAALGRLTTLVLASPGGGGHPNPVCACRDYRRDVFAAVRSLQALDGEAADGPELAAAGAAGLSASAGGAAAAIGMAATGEPLVPSNSAEAAAAVKGVGAGVSRRPPPISHSRSEQGAPGATDGIREALAASSRGGGAKQRVTTAAPEEVPVMPRFDALAGRFRSRRRWQRRGGEGEEPLQPGNHRRPGKGLEWSSGAPSSRSSLIDGGGWSDEDGDDSGPESHEACDIDRPEDTAPGSVMRRRKERVRGDGESERRFVGGVVGLEGRDALAEDAAEEHGLLSRLRSVAQEARLEVMDSRLQDLHEKQAKDAAGARRAAAAAAAVSASSRRGSLNRGRFTQDSGARGGRSNPWTQQQTVPPADGSAGSKTVPSNARGAGSTVGLASIATVAGDRAGRWTHASEGVAAMTHSGAGAGAEHSFGNGDLQHATAAARPRPGRFEGAPLDARCPCCVGANNVPELTLGVAESRRDRGRPSESPAPKHLSDASTQAKRGPAAAASRSSLITRTRRVPGGNPATTVPSAAEGTGKAGGGPSSIGIGRVAAAAAVVGAAAASLTAWNGRRLAVCFLRWARDTDRAKAEAAAAAAEAALADAGREAKREREAWEALQATLEGSAAAREREARETAEEAGRKELRSVSAACRSAEEAASALTLQLAQAEADTAAAVLKQQQAQAEAARAKADAEESVAASEARAKEGVERLEEKLRVKARAQSETEEECRRVRALLREAESRCRGLQDQLEESRARERRASADAEDARRRAAADADNKLATAVDSERERNLALKLKLKAAEDAARAATKAARAAAEGEASGRRVAMELAELAREQKAALQAARGEVGAARAERIGVQEAMDAMKTEAARKNAEMKELSDALEAREAELGAERQARRQHESELKAMESRVEALHQEKEEAEAKAAASAIEQGDLRAALMVKDKVLEDREKLVEEMRLREGDALAEAQGWRDRLEAQQSDADLQLDAAREEVSELQAKVEALSGVEDQLRDVFKELRRYRKRHEAEEGGNGGSGGGDQRHGEGGAPSRDGDSEPRWRDTARELTAVAAVTAAARAVEEELRAQLEAKDQALRYVENELLGMKSLFESKEACLREELGDERDKLAREAAVLRERLEQAEAGKAAAEETAREQALAADTLRSSLQSGQRRSKELEDTLRALLLKHTADMASAEATSRKLAKMADLFQQLQDHDEGTAVSVAPAHGPAPSFLNSSAGRGNR